MTCEFEDAPEQGQMAGILPGRGSPAIEPRTNHRRRLARPLNSAELFLVCQCLFRALELPEARAERGGSRREACA